MDTPQRHQLVNSILASSDSLSKEASVANPAQLEVISAVLPEDMSKQSSLTSVAQILAASEMAQA